MSIPTIPGYLGADESTLGQLWRRPEGSYPDELWPGDLLRKVRPDPSGWLAVEEYSRAGNVTVLRGCSLVAASDVSVALNSVDWQGRDLGDFATWASGAEHGYTLGLDDVRDGVRHEWFVHARDAIGCDTPQIEISLPFLWYWGAFRQNSGYAYLDAAGRQHPLIRCQASTSGHKVEVRVDEFRRYLQEIEAVAVCYLQLRMDGPEAAFDRTDDACRTSWGNFEFFAGAGNVMSPKSFGMINGNYVIGGAESSARRMCDDFEPPNGEYAEFIYAVDPSSGAPLKHTCDPKLLGSYFDKDASRVHYLTPVYFRPEVLEVYRAQPSKYVVSASRLSCLNIWGLDISINTARLVEVYLGDIGRRLPYQEWGHWSSCNVTPEGEMDRGRFQRDFLNVATESSDPIERMKRSHEAANKASSLVLGGTLWRQPPPDVAIEFASLMLPTSGEMASVKASLLLLAKAFVDTLDSKLLRRAVPDAEKDDKSLGLLRKWVKSVGGSEELVEILSDLYAVRSRGGVAHLTNSESPKVLEKLGFYGDDVHAEFRGLVERLSACFEGFAESFVLED